MGTSLFINSPEFFVTQMGSMGVEFLGGYLLGRLYIKDLDTFLSLLRALGLIVMFLLPFAAIESLTSRSLILSAMSSLPGSDTFRQFTMRPRWGLFRAQGISPHPILFGVLTSLAFAIVMHGLQGVVRNTTRYLMALAAVGCVFFSLSAGAFIGIVYQAFLLFWFFTFRRVHRRWLLLFALVSLAYIIIDLLSNRDPIRIFMTYATFSAHTAFIRMHIFDWGMVNVWANPVFGLGFRDWVRADFLRDTVDNFWLLNAMRYGIPGFLMIAFGYFWCLAKVALKNVGSDPFMLNARRAWVIAFSSLALSLVTVHVWSSTYSMVFFLYGSGVWFLLVRPAQSAPEEDEKKIKQDNSRCDTAPTYSRFPPRPRAVCP